MTDKLLHECNEKIIFVYHLAIDIQCECGEKFFASEIDEDGKIEKCPFCNREYKLKTQLFGEIK